MKKREDLIKTKSYWMVKIQNDLYSEVNKYLKENNLTQKKFADKLGVSKSYILQVLNGNFNFSLGKLIELCLAIDKTPDVRFEEIEQYIERDKFNLQKK